MAGVIFYGLTEYYKEDTRDPVITLCYKKRGKTEEPKVITFEFERPLNPEYPKFQAMETLRVSAYEYIRDMLKENQEGTE